jgi:hypothetical protein
MINGPEKYRFLFPTEIPEISPRFFQLYLRGNAIWPQRHLLNSFLISSEVLQNRGATSFTELLNMQFSAAQLEEIGRIINKIHTVSGLDKNFDPTTSSARTRHHVTEEEIRILWDGAVAEGADRVLAFTQLFPSLSDEFADFPHIARVYSWDIKKSSFLLKILDSSLTHHPQETQIMAEILKHVIKKSGDQDFLQLAAHYRQALVSSYNSFEGYQRNSPMVTDGQTTQGVSEWTKQACQFLLADLPALFPQLEWQRFEGYF